MTCRELIGFLNDYLAGALPPDERRRFDLHLGECEDCVVYLDGYRRTIDLARDALCEAEEPVPEDVPAALVEAILGARRKR